MNELPNSRTYEKEYKFFPWGILIKEILTEVPLNATKNSNVLDLMCGTGYLLNKIRLKRKDLILTGIDIDKRYINYAKKSYKGIKFICADALDYNPKDKFDLIIITAGLHHVPYKEQRAFVKRVYSFLSTGGKLLVADPYIRDYKNETERKKAAAELGYNYILSTLSKNPPVEIIDASIDIMANDIRKEEYKTSLKKIKSLLRQFKIIKFRKTWPKIKSEYGEAYWIVKK